MPLGRTPLLFEAALPQSNKGPARRPTVVVRGPGRRIADPKAETQVLKALPGGQPRMSKADMQEPKTTKSFGARIRAAGQQAADKVRTTIARRQANIAARVRRDDPSERLTGRVPQSSAKERRKGGSTQVTIPVIDPETGTAGKKKSAPARRVTQRLEIKPRGSKPIAKPIASSLDLGRTPLLQEIVANVTGNTFLSTTAPGSSYLGAPGDKEPHKSGNTSSKSGLVTKQGGVVLDKKRREIKIPDCTKLPKGRDAITRQLAAMQPSNAGGVLTLVRDRPKLLGG
jgi:hypothetical protein